MVWPTLGSRTAKEQNRTRKLLKSAYHKNYCIDSNQILHNTKDHQVLVVFVQIRPQQIQDGGRPPFWKTVKSRVLTLYLSQFVEPHCRRPDPDEYFSDERRAWTQLNHHHIAVQRQKHQVENLQTQSQQRAQIHRNADTETGTICPTQPLTTKTLKKFVSRFAYVIRRECLPPNNVLHTSSMRVSFRARATWCIDSVYLPECFLSLAA